MVIGNTLLGVVSLTFRELSKIIARKYTVISFIVRISIWNFVRVSKHVFGYTNKVSTWNSRVKCDFCNSKIPREYFGELAKRYWNNSLPFGESPWAVVGHAPLIRGAHQKFSVSRSSISTEWLGTWSGEGTETTSWCCIDTLFTLSWTMVASCMAQRRTVNLVTGQHPHHWMRLVVGALFTSSVRSMYTNANKSLLKERQLKLSMCYYPKPGPALTTLHITLCVNLIEPQDIFMSQAQMEKEAWPDHQHVPLLSRYSKQWPLLRSISVWFSP